MLLLLWLSLELFLLACQISLLARGWNEPRHVIEDNARLHDAFTIAVGVRVADCSQLCLNQGSTLVAQHGDVWLQDEVVELASVDRVYGLHVNGLLMPSSGADCFLYEIHFYW